MTLYDCGCQPLCDECIRQHMSWHKGIAYNRGERWARAIARVCPIDKPWPMTEKMRKIAQRQVQDLARDDRLLRLLTDEVIDGAARWWNAELERRLRDSG